jgi:hypothetical protein
MMHAALTLFRKTGEAVWKDLYCKAPASLRQSREERGKTGEWHWESHIFKAVRSYYGACHGVAGNFGQRDRTKNHGSYMLEASTLKV